MLTENEKEELSRLISATYEVLGQSVTPTAINFMVNDLDNYSVDKINIALTACRREVKGRFNLAEIIGRIDTDDGRLLPNEAWAIACHIEDESESAAVTPEILTALSVSNECQDKIAGRMAFIDCYTRLCKASRDKGEPAQWFMTLGTDRSKYEQAVQSAVDNNRISHQVAGNLLPDLRSEPQLDNLLTSAKEVSGTNEHARNFLEDMRSLFEPKREAKPDIVTPEKRAEIEAELNQIKINMGNETEI